MCPNTGNFPALRVTATGTNLEYQWYRNTTASTTGGTVITGATGSTYFPPSILPEGDYYYYCIVTGYCGTVTSGISGVHTITGATPTITISTSTETVCIRTTVSFTATSTYGGANPIYMWLVNGVAMQTGSSDTYTFIPDNGDVVTCRLFSDEPCVYPTSVISSGVTLTVLVYPDAPDITIDPLPAYPGELVDLLQAILKVPGMTYIFYENDDKTNMISGSSVTFNPPKNDYYVAADNGYCEGALSPINLIIPCPDFIKDDEDNVYKVTYIAGLCWTENLKSTKYPGTDSLISFANPYTCATCPAGLDSIFGLLYTWYSAVGVEQGHTLPLTGSVQGICPAGWRIPTQAEWSLLSAYSAEDLKSTKYWLDPPGAGADTYGFDARPAGWYNSASNRYQDLYGFTGWWAADAPAGASANYFSFTYYCDFMNKDEKKRSDGLSVRCVLNW
jgi:uncharacterized protein (TIGR02145 family)